MITKAKFAAVAVMVGTVLPVTYYLLLEPAAAGLATSSRTPGGGDLVAPGESRPMSSVGDLPMRVTVPDHAVEPTTLGSLLVRVRWPDDKQPAEGVLVRTRYYNYGHDPLTDPSGLTNESGTLTLENLRPGRMFVQTYRGGSEGGQKVVTLRAGEMSEVQLEIPAGLNVHGVVEDRVGNPIANADIVVASFSGWSGDAAALTRSGADGSFHLRSLATYCHVGARTEDYAPSPLHSVRGSKGDEVRVRIVLRDAGGAIHGRILDPRGRVVRDATIQVGEVRTGFLQLPDGSDALPPMPVRTLSDSDGRFAAEGLAPGRTSVAVRVRALAPWFGTIDVVAGVDQEIVVDLRPAATLSGTARDERGQPVAEATVLAKSGDVAVFGTRAFGDRVAKTDREGNYRLEGIGPGELQLHAWSKQGEAETRLFAVAGQSLQWNPVMSIGLTLRGRIVDEHGEPVMATLDSGLRNPDAAHPWHQFHTTDKAGRFQLQNCIPGEAIWIRVQAGSHTGTIVSATPDQRDVLIRVKSLRKPSVYITGQVLTSDGKPAANCSFLCIVKGRPGFTMVGADVETGRFQHGPYAPGDYRLRINVSGHPPVLTDWKPLTDDETWDLGVIRLERPGFLQVHLLGDATLVPPHGLFAVRAVPEKNGNFLRVANRIRVQDGKAERSGPMAAGKYVLQVSGDRCHCAVHEFEIQPGQSTRMDVAFERGTPVTLRFEIETDTGMLPTWDPIAVEVKDNSGRVILVDSAHPPESKLQFAARPGKYMVTATAETGQRAEFLLTVGDTPAEPKCIVLR